MDFADMQALDKMYSVEEAKLVAMVVSGTQFSDRHFAVPVP